MERPAPHRSLSNIRPTFDISSPGSPHTPTRAISAGFASPSTLRAEDDCIVLEIGNRSLRAGFAGDAQPLARIPYHPDRQRRAGDYRQYDAGYEKAWRDRIRGTQWGQDFALYDLELRHVDLALVRDKLERALREAFSKYLLIDSKPRKIALVLPTDLPLPILSTFLDTLFGTFQATTISLLASPVLTTIAAGLRAALVVDIGWAETIVTGVYEYREVICKRSVRGMKRLSMEVLQMLLREVASNDSKLLALLDRNDGSPKEQAERDHTLRTLINFDEVEDIMERVIWCDSRIDKSDDAQSLSSVQESIDNMRIPMKSMQPPQTIEIPFRRLLEPCESAFFDTQFTNSSFDDDEVPIVQLLYNALLGVPLDIRSSCMARIVFTGAGANIPGLKKRVMQALQARVTARGWNPVVSSTNGHPKKTIHRSIDSMRVEEIPKLPQQEAILAQSLEAIQSKPDRNLIARQEPQTVHKFDIALEERSRKHNPTNANGILRALDSMGSWCGGSLVMQLKIPAVSLIERELWIAHGLDGAVKAADAVVVNKRQSMAPKSGGAEKSSWTLGAWA